MDMNSAFFLKKEARTPQWHVIDASGMVLGRLSTRIADILRGKDKAVYTPHADAGDYVIVINSDKIRLTGNKWNDKIYSSFSGYRSGLKEVAAKDVFKKDPTRLILSAVKGMLPKNKLNRQVLKKLRIYTGNVHPHEGQIQEHAI